jgi:hypothetical protein
MASILEQDGVGLAVDFPMARRMVELTVLSAEETPFRQRPLVWSASDRTKFRLLEIDC